MLIAQISDMHIRAEGSLAYGRVETATFLARAVDHLRRLQPRPDLILATGDLADGGARDEYRRLRRLLEPLSAPVYLVAGNHDDRAALVSEFSDHRYLPRTGEFLQYTFDAGDLRVVVMDTVIPGKVGGEVCSERLGWLSARLGEARNRPTVVVMHHPPFETGIEFMDGYGFEGGEALGELIAKHPNVEAVLAGHLHRRISVRWRGTVVTTAPSTAHQVALTLAPGARGHFSLEPPACLLHLWRPGQGLVTHTSYIGTFVMHPFREERLAG
ncbi:MAG: phosphodiesterase [Candidatus Rokubacteria bacterium]|nr:phosphodiesterase [Candidatus Rokubacteria bacterium]